MVGVDLSREMIERAQSALRAVAAKGRVSPTVPLRRRLDDLAPFDGALSRYVVHHVIDPLAFVARQVHLLRLAERWWSATT